MLSLGEGESSRPSKSGLSAAPPVAREGSRLSPGPFKAHLPLTALPPGRNPPQPAQQTQACEQRPQANPWQRIAAAGVVREAARTGRRRRYGRRPRRSRRCLQVSDSCRRHPGRRGSHHRLAWRRLHHRHLHFRCLGWRHGRDLRCRRLCRSSRRRHCRRRLGWSSRRQRRSER
jgi:hypothetical protein